MHVRRWLPGFAVLALIAGLRADNSVRIVRLSLVTGAVQMNLPDGHGWRPALLNAPVAAGEQVRTLGTGRAEIQFENGSTLRLIPDSTVTITRLERSDSGTPETTVRLDQGVAFATVRKRDDADFRLLTTIGDGRQVEVTPEGSMRVRLTASVIQVFGGKARVASAGAAVPVDKDEQVALDAATLTTAHLAAPTDPMTRWSLDRDSHYDAALKHGVEPGSLTPAVNWSGGLPPMPTYTGTGLAFLNQPNCTWTETSGDYQSWCWTADRGWVLSGQTPTLGAGAVPMPGTVPMPPSSWASIGFYGGMGPMWGSPIVLDGGLGGYFPCDPFGGFDDLGLDPFFDCSGFDNEVGGAYGGVVYVTLMPTGIRRPPHRPLPGAGLLSAMRRPPDGARSARLSPPGSSVNQRPMASLTRLHPPPAARGVNVRVARRGFAGERAPLSRLGLASGARVTGPGMPARMSFNRPAMTVFRGSSNSGGDFSTVASSGAAPRAMGTSGGSMRVSVPSGGGSGPSGAASRPIVH